MLLKFECVSAWSRTSPFEAVTENLWSTYVLYMNSRFLYAQKEAKKSLILDIFKICISYCFRGLL